MDTLKFTRLTSNEMASAVIRNEILTLFIIWLVEFDKDGSTIVLFKLNSFAEYIQTIQKPT